MSPVARVNQVDIKITVLEVVQGICINQIIITAFVVFSILSTLSLIQIM